MEVTTYDNRYVTVVARTIDLLVAGWIWRDYGITISSWCALELRKDKPRRWARILGGFLNWLQPGHCEGAILADRERAAYVLEALH